MPEITGVDVAPQSVPEIQKNEPKLIHFRVDEKAFDSDTYNNLNQSAEKLNRLAEVTSLLRAWTGAISGPVEKLDPLTIKTTITDIQEKYDAWISMVDKIAASLDPDKTIKQETPTRQEIEQLALKLSISPWPTEAVSEIAIASPAQVAELETRQPIVNTVLHDIKSPITILLGGLWFTSNVGPEPEFLEKIDSAISKLRYNAKYCLNLLENPYPQKTLRADVFIKELEKQLSGYSTKMSSTSSPEAIAAGFTWANEWAESLAYNLAQNIDKSYQSRSDTSADKQAFVDSKIVEEDGRKFILISVEDRGTGLPVDFTGFRPGYTSWKGAKGTGVGMYSHLKALEDHYQGKLTVENVLDQDGNVIGAKVSLILPVKTES